MIDKISYLVTEDHDPYRNLALEEYLLRRVEPGECILYLWQNRHTVVIGRNQNCWKECRVSELEADGGCLARRLSGGGAVYHDLGNLNFTFLARRDGYDVAKQTETILRAVRSFHVPAARTGRNDLTVEGRKFSGNAYYLTDGPCYHHGTLLIHADDVRMARFLTVSREKLRSKSVDSVRSRVCNLDEYIPGLTVEQMREALLAAFSEQYGLPASSVAPGRISADECAALAKKYASPEWKYGRKIPFEYELEHRFSWGEVQLQLHVKDGRIADCAVSSDALDTDYLARVRPALLNCEFSAQAVCAALERSNAADEMQAAMRRDLKALMIESM